MLPTLELQESSAGGRGIDCETCPEGADAAITVYFPGVGNGVAGGHIRYPQQELDVVDSLGECFGAAGQFCCVKYLYLAEYNPRRRAPTNARNLAQLIEAEIANLIASSTWLEKIHLHLVGFSAGGIVAIHLAERLSCQPRLRLAPAEWCGRVMPTEIPFEMDLVTMATPFQWGRPVPGLMRLLATIGSFILEHVPALGAAAELFGGSVFGASIPSYYAGGAKPACLCRFISFVSSAAHGDTEAGDRYPGSDPRLSEWSAVPVPLAQAWPNETVPHSQVPARVLRDFRGYLDAECRCVGAP